MYGTGGRYVARGIDDVSDGAIASSASATPDIILGHEFPQSLGDELNRTFAGWQVLGRRKSRLSGCIYPVAGFCGYSPCPFGAMWQQTPPTPGRPLPQREHHDRDRLGRRAQGSVR